MPNMKLKAHAVLFISYDPATTRPMDVDEIAAKYDLQHYVNVELELQSDGEGGFIIDKLPDGYSSAVVHGRGKSISQAVTDWFHNLCSSIFYHPLYFKKREAPVSSP